MGECTVGCTEDSSMVAEPVRSPAIGESSDKVVRLKWVMDDGKWTKAPDDVDHDTSHAMSRFSQRRCDDVKCEVRSGYVRTMVVSESEEVGYTSTDLHDMSINS